MRGENGDCGPLESVAVGHEGQELHRGARRPESAPGMGGGESESERGHHELEEGGRDGHEGLRLTGPLAGVAR